MKNKSLLKRMILLVLTFAVVFSTVIVAYVQAGDSVTVEWVSSKESYDADEAIKLKLVVTNGTSEEKRFTYTVEIPEEVGINAGPEYSGVFSIGMNVTEELRWEKQVKETIPGFTPDDGKTEENEPTEPSVETEKETKDGSNVVTIILWVVLGLAVVAAVVFVILKRRGAKALIAVILCAGILAPMMAPLEVNAASASEPITVEKTITIGGKEVTLKATVTYETYVAKYTVAEDGVRVYETEAGRVMFEAEDQVLPGQDRIVVKEYDYVSGGKAVRMVKAAEDNDQDGQPDYADYSETLPAQMSFRFVADTAGTYAVWARMYAAGTATSMIVSTNGEEYKYTRMVETVPENEKDYKWGRIVTIECEPGDVVDIRIRSRHLGGEVDKLIISDNIAFVPSGMGTLPGQLYWDKVTLFDTETFPDPRLYPTEGQHPRVMFTEADIPGILERFDHPDNKAARVEFDKKRGTDFDGILPDIAEGSNYNANYLAVIEAKAFDYAIHKNSDNQWKKNTAMIHGEEAVSCMINFLQTVTFSGTGMDYRYIGSTLFTAAEVYDWCHDLLDDEEKALIVAGAQIQASMIEAGFPPTTTQELSFMGHDGEYQIQQCWLAFAIAVADEYPSIYDFIGGMYFDRFIDARNVWFPSMAYHQGSGYGPYRFDADLWGQWLIYQMTGGSNDLNGDGKADGHKVFTEETAKVIYHWMYTRRPDGKIMEEGDDYEMTQTNDNVWFDSLKSVIFSVANFYKDPVLYQELLRENPGLVPGSSTTIFSPVMILILNDPSILDETKENTEVSNMPLSRYLPTPYGGMIARTGWHWGMTSNDVLVTMQMAQRFVGGHQHKDVGSFQIYYKGLLSGDSGYYVIMGVDHDANYYKHSVAHNTLSITSRANPTGVQNGNMSVSDLLKNDPNSKFLRSKILGQEFGPNIYTPDYTYMAGDIKGAYDENVQEAIRSMLFLNLEQEGNTKYPGAFVVFDQITTSEPGSTKSFLLHATTRPTIEGNSIIIENTEKGYSGKLVNQIMYVGTAKAADSTYKITRIGGEGKEFWYDGKNHPNSSTLADNCAYEPGWGRIEVSTTSSASNQTDYMLNVMYVSDADGSTQVIPSTLIKGEGIMGAQIFNHVAMFNMDGNNRISKTVTFTIPESAGYSTFKVNVAGMKEGTWTVTANGKSKDYVASKDGGMLYFDAPAGKVTITRKNDNSNKTFDTVDHRTPVKDQLLYNINGNYWIMDTKPIKSGDTVLVPVLETFEAFESVITRKGSEITIQYMGLQTIVIDTAKKTATVNGKAVDVSGLQMSGNEVMVPVEALNALITKDYGEAEWDNRAKCVYVTARVPAYIPEEKRPFDNAIQVENVYLTDEKNTNVDTSDSSSLIKTLDNSTSTYTALAGYLGEAGAVYDFGKIYTLESIQLMFGHCKTRIYTFEILVSTDGVNFEALSGGKRFKSEKTKELYIWQEYKMPEDLRVRYVKLVGYGNEPDNNWFNWQEVVFIGVPEQKGEVINSGGTTVHATAGGKQTGTAARGDDLVVIKTQVVNGVVWAKIAWKGDYAWVRMAHVALFNDPDAKVRDTGKVVAASAAVYNMAWTSASVLGQIKAGTAVEILKTQTVDSVTYVLVRYNNYQGWLKLTDLALTADPDEFSTSTGKVVAVEGAKVYNRSSLSSIQMGILPAGTAIEIFQTKDIYGVVYGRIVYDKLEAWINLADVEIHNPNPPVHLEIEAEDTTLFEGKDPTMTAADGKGGNTKLNSDVIILAEDAKASGGKVAKLPWGGRYATGTVTGGTDLTVNPAHLSFTVEADRTATYFVWVCYHATIAQPTISSYIDGSVYRGGSSTKATGWQYDIMGDDDYNSIVSGGYVWYRLAICEWQSGESYTVRLRGRDGNVSYDKFVVTTDPGFSPSGEKDLVSAQTDRLIEAEKVTTNPLFTDILVDEALDSGKKVLLERPYVNDTLFTQNLGLPGAAPAIGFKVTAEKAGTYYIWGRFVKFSTLYASIAGYGSDYSYSYYKPNQKMEAKINNWYLIGTYEVSEAGETIYVRIMNRHTGNEIDQFYVTTDSEFMGLEPHEHSFSKKWSSDATHHWHAADCGCADLIEGKAEHIYSDDMDATCNTCGHTRKVHPHTYSDAWTSNERYHWHASTCGCPEKISGKAAHSYGADKKCTVCGAELVYVSDSELTFVEAEDIQLFLEKDNTFGYSGAPVMIADNNKAFGGKVAQWSWTANLNYNSMTGTNSNDLVAYPPHLSFDIKAMETGTHYVWARVSIDANTNIWTYIDGNFYKGQASAATGTGWEYDLWGSADNCTASEEDFIWVRIAVCNWEAGNTYSVRMRARNGRRIVFDRFAVTTDSSYAPNLEDKAAVSTDTVIEAEDTSLSMFNVGVENGVVILDKVTGTTATNSFLWGKGMAGHINFKVRTGAAGTYYIWGKFDAFSTYYTAISGSETGHTYTFGQIDKNKVPTIAGWYLIGTYETSAAGEIIYFRMLGRQVGNKIDQFYVTADSNFVGVKPHVHTYATSWSKDAGYHWHASTCGHADVVADKAAHIYSDDMDATCNTCGHTRQVHTHTFSDAWTSDAFHHWHASTCGCADQVSGKAEHTFGADKRCTVCGAEQKIIAGSNLTYIQAEDTQYFEGKDTTLNSGVAHVVVKTDDGNAIKWGTTGAHSGKTVAGSTDLTSYPVHISFDVTARTSGTYYIWARVCRLSNTSNCFSYIDGNSKKNATTGEVLTGWQYQDLGAGYDATGENFVWVKLATCTWEEGENYTVRFRHRQGSSIYDQFMVTSDAAYSKSTWPTT